MLIYWIIIVLIFLLFIIFKNIKKNIAKGYVSYIFSFKLLYLGVEPVQLVQILMHI